MCSAFSAFCLLAVCLFIEFLNILQVLCFSFSHCLLNFPYAFCVLSISFSQRLFVPFPYVLWVLSFFFFFNRLFVNFPYVLWVVCFLFSYSLFVNFPCVLWVLCFLFSKGVTLNISDMFWIQFSFSGSLVFLVPSCFANNAAALQQVTILNFSKLLISSSLFHVFPHVVFYVSFTFLIVVNWIVFISILCTFAL